MESASVQHSSSPARSCDGAANLRAHLGAVEVLLDAKADIDAKFTPGIDSPVNKVQFNAVEMAAYASVE